jgi:hypothetical protein
MRRRKHREQAHQYNRRTTFKVISQEYVPKPKEEVKEIEGPTIELEDKKKEDVKKPAEDLSDQK